MSDFKCIYRSGKECEMNGWKCSRRKCEAWNECECCERQTECEQGQCE